MDVSGRRWKAYVCPICLDGPQLGPVSGREWSCSNGHEAVDAVMVEVVPAPPQGAVSAMRQAIDAEEERFSRFDPDPEMFARLRAALESG
jgi:hypothetical protein